MTSLAPSDFAQILMDSQQRQYYRHGYDLPDEFQREIHHLLQNNGAYYREFLRRYRLEIPQIRAIESHSYTGETIVEISFGAYIWEDAYSSLSYANAYADDVSDRFCVRTFSIRERFRMEHIDRFDDVRFSSYVCETLVEMILEHLDSLGLTRNASRMHATRARNTTARFWGDVLTEPPQTAANKKAEKLLFSCMTKKQKSDYKKHQYFFVIGNVTGDRYKITKARQINIYKVSKKGTHLSRHCVVFSSENSDLPIEDHLLAQKLLIESNEQHFLEIKIDWN